MLNPYFIDLLHEKELFLYALKEPMPAKELINLRDCVLTEFEDALSMWLLSVKSTGPAPRERTDYFNPDYMNKSVLYLIVAVNMPKGRANVTVLRDARGDYKISTVTC